MKLDEMNALEKLRYAEWLLDNQELSGIPKKTQLEVLAAQQVIYMEIQAIQARPVSMRTSEYSVLTKEFSESRHFFEKLEAWATEANKSGEMVEAILKGAITVLTVL